VRYLLVVLILTCFHANASYWSFINFDNKLTNSPSYNSFGQIGLIQTPTAQSKPEGTVAFTFNRNDIWKFGTLTVTPFDWLEASYFYYRPSDLRWDTDNVRGHYLDKGFNLKISYPLRTKYISDLAIGLDDFAGTGLLSREYIVSTSVFDNFKFTLGIGWGKYVGKNSFENPLSIFSEKFNTRPVLSANYNTGGSPSFDQWFRGPSSMFGGVELDIPLSKGLKLKLEYDPFDYFDFSAINRPDAIFEIRKKDSNINYGLTLPINEYTTIDLSFIKGNTINLNFNLALTFKNGLTPKNKFKPVIKNINNNKPSKRYFYEDLLHNLNNNNLLLQTSTLNENGDLNLAIATSNHRNAIRSSSYTAFIAEEVAKNNDIDLSTIKVSHINAGIELNNISYVSGYINNKSIPMELKIKNTILDSGSPNAYLNNEFKPRVDFPIIFSSIGPSIRSHIGNPEKFYFGGINIQHVSEIQFSRQLLLSSEIIQPVKGNFRNTLTGSGSVMEHVRTDTLQYLQEDDFQISRLQLDYIWSPSKDMYSKVSGGLFETMFGGVGGEFLYKPFSKNYSLGFEAFYVKQRSYKQRFDFRDYETFTGHINLGYMFSAGIESNLSFGKYLAKDKGYTLDIGRRTNSGFKAGIYFTRTNVSAQVFGEGSFDKGFYFQIPMELFSKQYKGNYSTFKLSPLTRDGGAKLIHDKDLKGLIYNSTNYELSRQWNGFYN
jgi:hypothetical protein